jgi:hypothetical protein
VLGIWFESLAGSGMALGDLGQLIPGHGGAPTASMEWIAALPVFAIGKNCSVSDMAALRTVARRHWLDRDPADVMSRHPSACAWARAGGQDQR